MACFCSTFASSVLSAATHRIAEYFHVSVEVASLSSALYLVGYAVGPIFWAPLSELRGRKLPLVIGNFGFSVFAVATAVSKDIQTLMISRFFMGVFGSAAIVIVAALYSDMYNAKQRGPALTVFAVSIFLGPMLGPIIGSFTVTSYLGWRWDSYWSMIMGFTTFILIVFFLKETYPPTVLVSKAALLRRGTKNWAIHAKQEEIEIDLREMVEKNLSRPLRMLFTEPILILIGIYLSFVYGLIYITLSAFPLVFQGVHGMSPGVGSLPFLGIAIGMIGSGLASLLLNKRWVAKYVANGQKAVPEWRLPLAMVGGVAFCVGLFWFGWTGAYHSVHWIVPTLAGVLIGFGLLSIFMQLTMYIVDAYLML
jgi:DHA1 family multidrug resistance protein-like MFS transporter